MGIEQSTYQNSQSPTASKLAGGNPRNKSRQDSTQSQTPDENGRSSPHPSCSSDTDVPYVSYTVNRPIGGNQIVFSPTLIYGNFELCITESPKHQGKPNGRSGKSYNVSYGPSQPLKGRNIVVVSQKTSMLDDGEEDSEILTLGVSNFFLLTTIYLS